MNVILAVIVGFFVLAAGVGVAAGAASDQSIMIVAAVLACFLVLTGAWLLFGWCAVSASME